MLIKIILTIILSPFLLQGCSSKEVLSYLCKVDGKKAKEEKYQSIKKNLSRDINLFVVNNDLYLDYNFKKIYNKYKEMNSNYLKLKVIDRLSAVQGFDNGVVHNENFEDNDHHMSTLEVRTTGQGPNTNFYSSDNFVPFDDNIHKNINQSITDQAFLIGIAALDKKNINEFIENFLTKGRCQGGDKYGKVISERNFNGVHIILESEPEWFVGKGQVNSFAYTVYYTKVTDKIYEKSLYY
ncbi:hypothetical protein [Acinetobacter sp.]|jgi:hypothetical protein|uniref:hypothetical protein n=1 Tax=Acinetobacter sp. TaxID=472 RepID=UPI00283255EE|nr:hypothetical protein [Acinetobacter sp.]MDR0237480.1 hypothetical protein [Acinetobacter sp.]